MPTYLYECEKCGEFEVEQGMSEAPLDSCPTCGGTVRRMIAGGVSLLTKGGGAAGPRCGRGTPCCGRATRCDKPPCER